MYPRSLMMKFRHPSSRATPSLYSCVRRVVDEIPTLIKRRGCCVPSSSSPMLNTARHHSVFHECFVLRNYNILIFQVYPVLCLQIWAWRLSHISKMAPHFRCCLRVWWPTAWKPARYVEAFFATGQAERHYSLPFQSLCRHYGSLFVVALAKLSGIVFWNSRTRYFSSLL